MYFCRMMLEQVISNLILKHACVIVPDFGGFISQRVPAVLDFKSGKMVPPSKAILFNKQLLASDGLLVGAYAKHNKISYEEASAAIKNTVINWRSELSSGNRVSLEHIGYLYLDITGQVCFEQDKFTNLLLSSYGLVNITISSTQTEDVKEATAIEFVDFNAVKEVAKEETTEPKVIEINLVSSKKLHWTRYVAAAALLPIVFYSFWIPVKTDFLQSGILSIHDFNPFKQQQKVEFKSTTVKAEKTEAITLKDVQKEVEKAHVEETYSYEVDGSNYKTILVEKEIPEGIDASQTVTKKETIISPTQNTFFVIGNCFGVEENANNYVQEMKSKGCNAQIVDQVNGLFRVAIGAANSSVELEKIKSDVQAKGITNFWILKK